MDKTKDFTNLILLKIMKEYTLYHLGFNLHKFKQGDLFKIRGQDNTWEFFDENKDYYFLKNTISKQKILIEK